MQNDISELDETPEFCECKICGEIFHFHELIEGCCSACNEVEDNNAAN